MKGVTFPEPGDDYLARIPVEAILRYEVAAIPAPANLMVGQPVPTRHVHEIKVKQGDEWVAL